MKDSENFKALINAEGVSSILYDDLKDNWERISVIDKNISNDFGIASLLYVDKSIMEE